MRLLKNIALTVGTLGAAAVVGCTPTLNWRDVRPADSDFTLLFPCKPDVHSRRVRLAGSEVTLALHACNAGDVTWALAVTDVGDATRVGAALEALREAAAANLGARATHPLPLDLTGATPHPASGRFALTGQLPDGQAVQEHVALFARGTRVYQATCVGKAISAADADTFFKSLQLR